MIPNTFTKLKRENLLWVTAFNSFQSIPTWTGWNTKKHTETSPQKLVCYMKQMQLSPTWASLVKETLKGSQVVAEECGPRYSLVTYGLAIAKIAKRIQCEETPQLTNVYIMFGSFHIEMAFFSSLVKIIESSEGPYLLSESSVVAMGFINKLS